MGQNINLNQEFDLWFNENQDFVKRSELVEDYIRTIVHSPLATSTKQMEVLLKLAYLAGARRMAQDTLDTLGDYGTATAGCAEPLRNPTECYDAAHANLMTYYTQVFK